ncbi:MAG TPA: hypothetical protein VJJ46_05935 [Anaerolineales bacterium]|nr:hypothetical protein [Anaerolineales bacterium]
MPRPVIRASSVLARSSGEAIASLRPAEDGPHAPQTPEYFEWWYFDHHFVNGYTAVVVFHRATAFLPSHPPAVEITVITPSGEELRSFRTLSPAEFRVAADRADIQAGEDRVVDGTRQYQVRAIGFTQAGLRIGVETTLEGLLPGWKFGESKTLVDGLDAFAWVVPLPRARCLGTLFLGDEAMPVAGTGYHDHNWGQVSLTRLLAYWHWGRIYADDVTCIYADVVGRHHPRGVPTGLLMLAVGERIIFNTSLVRIEEQDLTFSRQANRTYPRALRITSEMDGAPIELTLTSRELVGAYDFLASLPPLRRRLIRLLARPAYFRHRSDVHLRFTYAGRPFDLRGEVLNEDMYLQRR